MHLFYSSSVPRTVSTANTGEQVPAHGPGLKSHVLSKIKKVLSPKTHGHSSEESRRPGLVKALMDGRNRADAISDGDSRRKAVKMLPLQKESSDSEDEEEDEEEPEPARIPKTRPTRANAVSAGDLKHMDLRVDPKKAPLPLDNTEKKPYVSGEEEAHEFTPMHESVL